MKAVIFEIAVIKNAVFPIISFILLESQCESRMCTSIRRGHAAFVLSGSDVVRPAAGLVHRGGHEAQDAGYQTDDLCGAQVHVLISFHRSIASLFVIGCWWEEFRVVRKNVAEGV